MTASPAHTCPETREPCDRTCRGRCLLTSGVAAPIPGACPETGRPCVWLCGPRACRETCPHDHVDVVRGQALDRHRRHVVVNVAICRDCGDLAPNLQPGARLVSETP